MSEELPRQPKGFLEAGPLNPALRSQSHAALEARLGSWPPGGKAGHLGIGAAGLVGFLVCGSLALSEPESTPPAVKGLLGLLSLFGLGWTIFAVRALARRRGGLVEERILASRIAFGFTFLALNALAVASVMLGKEATAPPMLFGGLAFLILAGVGLINARIEDSELAIREQLLRLEEGLYQATGSKPTHGNEDLTL